MDGDSEIGQQRPRIVLVGMMGSGKTTVGRLLAQRLAVPYLDNDEILKARTGMYPTEILEKYGTGRLRKSESKALAEALSGDKCAVVGAAAGAILDPANRQRIRQGGRVVWLRGRPQTLVERLGTSGYAVRPRFGEDMGAWVREQTLARSPFYAQVADEMVDVDDRSPDQVVDAIVAALADSRAAPQTAPSQPAGPPAEAEAATTLKSAPSQPAGPSAVAEGFLPGPYRAVVFDLDGLLVETETIWMEAKVRLFRAHGVEFSIEDHRAVFGTSEDFTAKTFLRRFGLDETKKAGMVEEYLGLAEGLFAAGVATRPGAIEIVAALRGRVLLGLASNTRRELVDLILDHAGLTGCFEAIATGDEARPKPEPDVYTLACARLGVDPADAVAIEDSPTGIRAAKAAGMTCIAVPSDPEVHIAGADRVVPSLLDLLESRSAGGT